MFWVEDNCDFLEHLDIHVVEVARQLCFSGSRDRWANHHNTFWLDSYGDANLFHQLDSALGLESAG